VEFFEVSTRKRFKASRIIVLKRHDLKFEPTNAIVACYRGVNPRRLKKRHVCPF